MHTVAHFMCEWIFAPFCSRFGKGDGVGDGEVLGGTESVQSLLPPPEEETLKVPEVSTHTHTERNKTSGSFSGTQVSSHSGCHVLHNYFEVSPLI